MNPSRVVLVTGGSKGIGHGIAAQLAEAGHRVAATYRSGEVPQGVLAVQCDVTDPEQVEAAFAQVESALGNVEVLVANAGITRDTLLMRMSDEDWNQVIATNLTGAFRVARRAARPMIRGRSAGSSSSPRWSARWVRLDKSITQHPSLGWWGWRAPLLENLDRAASRRTWWLRDSSRPT